MSRQAGIVYSQNSASDFYKSAMRLSTAAIALLVARATGFAPSATIGGFGITGNERGPGRLSVAAAIDETLSTGSSYADINKLSYRQLQKGCRENGLLAVGNTAALRAQLLEFHGIVTRTDNDASEAAVVILMDEECDPDISFCDQSDPDFDFRFLRDEVMEKASVGHWKAATRKLKKLKKNYASAERVIEEDVYHAVLTACAADRLHGARASEPARKIMEDMAEQGYYISTDLGNEIVMSCIGVEAGAKHEGFGGIDTALAMLAAMESSAGGGETVTVSTYGAVISALCRDGAIDEAILLLRAMVVERFYTPPLSTFAEVAQAAAKDGNMGEGVLQVLRFSKAAGYELDSIASAQVGRDLLASGVIVAEQMDNVALGLRLLTAAGKADGCAPDRGDDLVAASSGAAQRASTLIHKRAIDKSVADNNWKLAVKLLELMPERSLTPATSVWRKVLTICCKSEKSRKATAILLDWVKLSEEGKADKPPVSVFNTVVNACEICGEEDLTVLVLETMNKVHNTEGNIITANIALKRLARLGNKIGCEGIIIGMLQAGTEPNVVSYTTAIGACANAPQDPAVAYEWLNRMRSRNVMPNFHTYNTALAACLDGKLESTALSSKIATEMVADVEMELEQGRKGSVEYHSVMPDSYTKVLSRALMKKLRDNWRNGDINMAVAKATLRVPLLKLVDFEYSEAAERVKKQHEEESATKAAASDDENIEATEKDAADLEYDLIKNLHKDSHRIAELSLDSLTWSSKHLKSR